MKSRRELIVELLKGIETGDPKSVEVVSTEKYIQHNPMTQNHSEGLAELFKQISLTSPKVNILRAFEDNDFVFAHGEYDFSGKSVVFEVFRFEGDKTVEHWDNLQSLQGPNASGRTMLEGPTEPTDLELTETNRTIVSRFVEKILINKKFDTIGEYIDNDLLVQHNSFLEDGFPALRNTLEDNQEGKIKIQYQKNHRVLCEGNFALAVNEGYFNDEHCGIYDLFRVDKGYIAEHWNTVHFVPPKHMWRNHNGKF